MDIIAFLASGRRFFCLRMVAKEDFWAREIREKTRMVFQAADNVKDGLERKRPACNIEERCRDKIYRASPSASGTLALQSRAASSANQLIIGERGGEGF